MGNTLRVGLDRTDITGGADRFNLTIQEATPGGRSERIIDLSLADDNPRRADQVLERQSALVRWDGPLPADTTAPTEATDALSAAEGVIAEKEEDLADAKKAVKAKEQAGEEVPPELLEAVADAEER